MTLTGIAVRVIRRAQKLGIRDLERLTGLDRGWLSRFERGERKASPEVMGRIAGALNIPADATPDDVLHHIDHALQMPPDANDTREEKP